MGVGSAVVERTRACCEAPLTLLGLSDHRGEFPALEIASHAVPQVQQRSHLETGGTSLLVTLGRAVHSCAWCRAVSQVQQCGGDVRASRVDEKSNTSIGFAGTPRVLPVWRYTSTPRSMFPSPGYLFVWGSILQFFYLKPGPNRVG